MDGPSVKAFARTHKITETQTLVKENRNQRRILFVFVRKRTNQKH